VLPAHHRDYSGGIIDPLSTLCLGRVYEVIIEEGRGQYERDSESVDMGKGRQKKKYDIFSL